MAVREDTQVLARIGFAQRWLERARRQCTDGNLARSALTLVLAGAEVRHALEAAGAAGETQSRRISLAAYLLMTAALLSVFVLVSRWPGMSGSLPSPAPPLLQLSSSSGALLQAMGALTAASSSSPAHFIAGPAVTPHAQGAQPAAPLITLDTAGTQPLGTGGGSAGLGSSHISMSELIDLVLAAERALRQEPAGRSSP